MKSPIERNRVLYAVLIGLVIGLGLLWRSPLIPLPRGVAKYGGDSLWALCVFLAFGFVFPRTSTARVAFMAVCVAWSIEFSQLSHADWIEKIRATLPGRLILGNTYNTPDLLAYLFGIAFGAVLECVRLRTKLRSTTNEPE